MICGHCIHWQLIDLGQVIARAPKSQHIGRCRFYSRNMTRASACDQFQREPGSDDDQGEYGKGAAYRVASNY